MYKYSYKNRLLKPRLIANIKEVPQRLYACIKWESLIKAILSVTLVLLNNSFNVLPK